jgi:hypothetical protein
MRIKLDKEWSTYADTGCLDGLYPSCLNCPLSQCRYDGGKGIRTRVTEEKAKVAQWLWLEEDLNQQQIASRLGVSQKTVSRYLQRQCQEG